MRDRANGVLLRLGSVSMSKRALGVALAVIVGVGLALDLLLGIHGTDIGQ